MITLSPTLSFDASEGSTSTTMFIASIEKPSFPVSFSRVTVSSISSILRGAAPPVACCCCCVTRRARERRGDVAPLLMRE